MSNLGHRSTGDGSTGYRSTGYRSTGNRSTGAWSTGHWSTGDGSTGYRSTGNRSTGHWSTGDGSTGHWSTGDFSVGHFSTEDYSPFGCFDKKCTKEAWDSAEKPSCLCFDLTEWVNEADMTKEQKADNPNFKTTGGFFVVHDYKDAFSRSMRGASKDEIDQIKRLPNFDAQKFYEISGFMIKDTRTITIDGKDIEISQESFEAL